jgi:hypothetical protein
VVLPARALTPLRGAVGLLVSGVCLFLLVREVDLARVGSALAEAQLPLVALAVAATIVDVLLRSRRWQVLLEPVRAVAFLNVVRYTLVGYLANNVLPARLGEVVRCHYLGDREGLSRATALGTVLVERIVDTAVVAALAAASVALLGLGGGVGIAVAIGLALSALLVVGLAVAVIPNTPPGTRGVRAALGRLPLGRNVIARLHEGMAVAARPRTLRDTVLLSLASWAAGIVAFGASAQAVGVVLQPLQLVAVTAVVTLATAIPSGPGYLGPFELAAVRIMGAMGIGTDAAFAAAIIAHVVVLATTSLGGAISLVQLSVGGAARRNDADEPASRRA